ncbi:hypothetical protein [Streptomyces sp. NPDC001843]|uniref:hypothetical protein n=1 Tax=Streptomyces sp. NPDC001843 TaxID=3364617 RepID=UPI0036993C2D
MLGAGFAALVADRAALTATRTFFTSGRPLDPDDPLAEENLRPSLDAAGWAPTCYEDAPRQFLARAVRIG